MKLVITKETHFTAAGSVFFVICPVRTEFCRRECALFDNFCLDLVRVDHDWSQGEIQSVLLFSLSDLILLGLLRAPQTCVLEGVVGCPRDGERNAEWLKVGQVSDLRPCDSTCLYNFSEEPFPINHILCRNTQISNINSKQQTLSTNKVFYCMIFCFKLYLSFLLSSVYFFINACYSQDICFQLTKQMFALYTGDFYKKMYSLRILTLPF